MVYHLYFKNELIVSIPFLKNPSMEPKLTCYNFSAMSSFLMERHAIFYLIKCYVMLKS